MTYSYRLAGAHDGKACAKIVQDWCAETPWLPPLNDFERLADWWSRCLHHVPTSWVCEHNGTVVGYCVREDDNINALYIAPAARSHGVGKRLLDIAKTDRNWITVWAYAKNTRALKFYQREGCVELSREVEDDTGLIEIEHRWTRPT